MVATRRQLDGLAGLDGQAVVERAHRHHAVIDSHFVDLDFFGNIRRTADQPIRRRALVLDGEIAAANFRSAGRRAAPGLRDHEIAGLDLLSACRRGDEMPEHGGASDGACDGFDPRRFDLHLGVLFRSEIYNKWIAGCSVPSTPTIP